MFIAHLPAGYLLARGLQRATGQRNAGFLATGCVASVLPDTDLAWFYLVDNRQTPHHDYLFHAPLFWVALCAIGWALGRLLGMARAGAYAGCALAGLLLHMALDSFAADIRWLWPFTDARFELTRVPNQGYDWWVWNFVLHWTFAAELALCVCALGLLISDLRKSPSA